MTTTTRPRAAGSSGARTESPERLDRLLARLVLAACALLVVGGIGPSLLGLSVFGSTDVLYERPPWSAQAVVGEEPANAYVGDPVDAVYPPMREVVDRLRGGDIAAWTSLQTGGAELAAVPSLALLSPATLPYFLLPLWLAPAYVKLLEIAIAIGGMYLYCRRAGLGRAAGLLGGLAFASCGFLIAWTNWPQSRTAALVPALFWAVERLVQQRSGRSVAVLALVVAALVLSGFPSVTAYALYSAAAYVLVRLVAVELGPGGTAARAVRRVAGGLALAAAGVTAGIAVTAVQLLPFMHQLGTVHVGSREQTPEHALSVVSLVTVLVPDGLGTPVSASTWFGPRNPVESFSYVGVGVMLLAALGALGLARARPGAVRGLRAFLVVAVATWGVAVYAGGPVLAAIQLLPAMDVNPIGRARSVLGFFVAALAAVGYDALVRATADRRRDAAVGRAAGGERAVRAVGWVAVAAGAVAVFGIGFRYAAAEGFSAGFTRSALVAAALLTVCVLAVLLAVRTAGRSRLVGLALLPVVVLGQAVVLVQPWWPESPRESFYPPTATHDFLAAHLGNERYLSTDDAMLPGSNLAYGLRSLDGHAFLRNGMTDLFRAVDPDGFVAPTLWHPALAAAAAPEAAPLLDRLAVRYLVAPPDADVVGTAQLHGDGGAVVPWAAGRTTGVDLDGPVRGVGLVLAADVPTPAPGDVGGAAQTEPPVVEARLLDAAGEVVVSGTRDLAGARAGDEVAVAVPEDERSADAVRAELTLVSGPPVQATGAAGVPRLLTIPGDDGLRVVRTGEATVYERLTALPRVRWAGTASVDAGAHATVDLLGSDGTADVVLERPGPAAAGSVADVAVVEDSGDSLRVRIDAAGAGYLVVADAVQDTFVATLDGEPVELRVADHGYVAVAVPAGAHDVALTYRAPGGWAGPAVSAMTLLLLLGLIVGNPGGRAAAGYRARPYTRSTGIRSTSRLS